MSRQTFKKIDKNLYVDGDLVDAFKGIGLDSLDAVFAFSGGENLVKANLGKHRARISFTVGGRDVFLKRYDKTPMLTQIKNWIAHTRKDFTSGYDRTPAEMLAQDGINSYKVLAYGGQWGKLFEKRSFIVIEKIPNAESLEKKLPAFFYDDTSNQKQRTEFIDSLADFTRRFHRTGFRHRDYYLAHIFADDTGQFHLIDLHRAFKPILFGLRFRLKDLTQLYYSSPGQYITRTDRLRFYMRYKQKSELSGIDKLLIWSIKTKAWKMADHDIKHGRDVPFAS
ncbi:MAG: hypothetical protein KAJ07_10795 [Planctomycetes bacterium]|nr:hypothetical protein [Planctomycetota bacterium]